MASTKIRGNTQIIDYTIDIGRLEQDFLNGADWDITNGAQDYGIRGVRLTPINDDELTSKFYVDSIATGLDWKDSCQHATLIDMSGVYTSTGGPNGTGAFTGVDTTSTGAVFDIDIDHEVDVDERIVVMHQTDPKQNGIYTITSTGVSGGLIRATDHDGVPGSEVSASNATFVEHGSIYGQTGWIVLGTGILTLNVDDIVWAQFSGSGTYTAGDGLDLTGTQFSVDVTDIIGEGLTESSNNIDISWGGSGGDYGSATTVARSDHDHDSVYSPLGHDHSGTYAELAFTTINTPSGTDPVADSTTDTLNLATGGPITITGDSGTDTITFDIGADGILNEHVNWGGTGETAIDAEDIPLNTSTGTYAGVATNIQEALEEIEANVSSNYTFKTMNVPNGTNPVAESSGDTLNYTSDNSTITITGDSGTDTIDFDIAADAVDETHLDLGSGSNQIDATTIPIDSGGTYAGAAANVQDALEEIEVNNLQFKTIVPTTGTNVVADNPTDTLTLTSDNTTIVVTGDGGTDTIDFDIAADGVDETHLDLGSGSNQIDATTIPIDSGGTWGGSAANVQDALEELESDISSHYAFLTVSTPSGTSPVAETTTDTLTLATGGPITITGDSGTDTVTFDIGADGIKDTHIDWGTGASQISGGDIPLADAGTYFATDDVESALQELAAAAPGFGVTRVFEETPAISHGTPTVTLSQTPTAGTVRIFVNGLRQEDSNDYSIAGAVITFTFNLLSTPGQSDIVLCDFEY